MEQDGSGGGYGEAGAGSDSGSDASGGREFCTAKYVVKRETSVIEEKSKFPESYKKEHGFRAWIKRKFSSGNKPEQITVFDVTFELVSGEEGLDFKTVKHQLKQLLVQDERGKWFSESDAESDDSDNDDEPGLFYVTTDSHGLGVLIPKNSVLCGINGVLIVNTRNVQTLLDLSIGRPSFRLTFCSSAQALENDEIYCGQGLLGAKRLLVRLCLLFLELHGPKFPEIFLTSYDIASRIGSQYTCIYKCLLSLCSSKQMFAQPTGLESVFDTNSMHHLEIVCCILCDSVGEALTGGVDIDGNPMPQLISMEVHDIYINDPSAVGLVLSNILDKRCKDRALFYSILAFVWRIGNRFDMSQLGMGEEDHTLQHFCCCLAPSLMTCPDPGLLVRMAIHCFTEGHLARDRVNSDPIVSNSLELLDHLNDEFLNTVELVNCDELFAYHPPSDMFQENEGTIVWKTESGCLNLKKHEVSHLEADGLERLLGDCSPAVKLLQVSALITTLMDSMREPLITPFLFEDLVLACNVYMREGDPISWHFLMKQLISTVSAMQRRVLVSFCKIVKKLPNLAPKWPNLEHWVFARFSTHVLAPSLFPKTAFTSIKVREKLERYSQVIKHVLECLCNMDEYVFQDRKYNENAPMVSFADLHEYYKIV